MDLTPDAPRPADAHADDIALYAIDALEPAEAARLEVLLATDARAAAFEATMRQTAGAFAEGAQGPGTFAPTEPPAELRARVLDAAFAARPPRPVEPATAVEVHGIELERFVSLLDRLEAPQWGLGLDPPEFAGWTIHDLAAHVTANEGLLAQLLGLRADGLVIPETINDNEARTAEAIVRHRAIGPDATIAELHELIDAIDRHVRTLSDAELDREVAWWGVGMRVRTVLLVRSFETWTHADDIRRALGLAQLPPPAPALRTMSTAATGWTALMTAASGHDLTGRSVRFRLTGAGGTAHHVDLGLEPRDLTGVEPDAEITVDIVDYCRAVGDRFPTGPLRYEAAGDIELADLVVRCLPALATL